MIRIVYKKETGQIVMATHSSGITAFNKALYDSFECEEEQLNREITDRGLMGVVQIDGAGVEVVSMDDSI